MFLNHKRFNGDKMFSVNYRVRLYDTDAAGILFFGNIFRIMHLTLEKFIESRSIYDLFFKNQDYIFPVKNSSADFKKPMILGDEIKVELNISMIKETSFEIKYLFYDLDNNLTVSASTVHVCVDKKSGKKNLIPVAILDFLNNN